MFSISQACLCFKIFSILFSVKDVGSLYSEQTNLFLNKNEIKTIYTHFVVISSLQFDCSVLRPSSSEDKSYNLVEKGNGFSGFLVWKHPQCSVIMRLWLFYIRLADTHVLHFTTAASRWSEPFLFLLSLQNFKNQFCSASQCS